MPISQKTFIAERVVSGLTKVLGGPANLHEPSFDKNELLYLKHCIESGWVSTAGKYIGKFEKQLKRFTGSKYIITTSSGTSALHAVFAGLNIGRGDEVIVPALSFVATSNAVSYTGANPHLADIEKKSLGLDQKKLRKYLGEIATIEGKKLVNCKTGKRIAGIVCMHAFGHPSDLDPLVALSKDLGIPLIEDAAESLGSYYKGKHTGNMGHASILSFNGNKTITTGGGGAIMTNNSSLAKKLRHLVSTAKKSHDWEFLHNKIGFNYRLPNINAALGCAQMEILPKFLKQKRTLARAYKSVFLEETAISTFSEPPWAKSNYWLNILLLDQPNIDTRNAILTAANVAGFAARAAWRPMHLLPMYMDAPRMDLSVTENMYARIINIPSGAQLAERLNTSPV